ncbi:hypothetical protein D3273_21785 [Lichenibacterium minor]|uniref:Uncharacterized protein n=1 Tax=Lichenibacterium minor TaxID=2316528 RepID=A0A4Q2U091_9HYPH|nr:hypothetical protein [Lichenibacterium minor]RYC29833.1 hypothetical protein D3273_21785 [Lichenibacterium minor]
MTQPASCPDLTSKLPSQDTVKPQSEVDRSPVELPPIVKPIYARLADAPISDEGRALVDTVLALVHAHEKEVGKRKYQRRDEQAAKFKKVVAAFLADLLRSAGQPETGRWVYRSLRADSYPAHAGVSRTDFEFVREGFRALKLVEMKEGGIFGLQGYHTDDTDDEVVTDGDGSAEGKRAASHFRGTDKLLGLAGEHGVRAAEVGVHFAQDLPLSPVVLHAEKTKVGKREVRGKPIIVTPKSPLAHLRPAIDAMDEDLRELNNFLANFNLEGGQFRGYRRIYNLADKPDFKLDKGARLYANGDPSYQSMSKEDRQSMKIDGDEVVEMDVKASYLTILHGTQNRPFDAASHDPYEVKGLSAQRGKDGKDLRRWAVKNWVVATLGAKRHHRVWPDETVKEYETKGGGDLEADYPIKLVREAMVERFSILGDWGKKKLGMGWADLMFIESEAMLATMMDLMRKHSAPSLSVHDSLLVRTGDAQVAKELLQANYVSRCGLVPVVE